MASVSSLGVGSGLGLSDILDSLKTAEKASLKPISTQQSANTAKLSAYGTLKSALTTFQTANSTLNNANLFGSSKVSSTSTAFSATTTSSAAAGKYTVSVTQLAAAQTLTSGVKSDATTALATSDSTITIQQGGGKKPITVPVTAANSSLNGIRDAINKADPSVNASVIKVADGSYRLSLTASDTGSDNAMTLSVTGDSDLQSFIAYDGTASGNMTQSVAAQNAQLTVNNVAIESDSNTISDALDGVTLTLNDRTTGNQSLSVTKDTTSASSALSAWVDAYNTLQDSFSSLTKYTAVDTNADAQSSTNGALIGDSTLRTIQTQLKTMLTNSQSSSTYKSLSQIGITTDPKTGKLELDKEKLSTSLAKDPDGIKAMIIGDGKTTGVATKIGTNITGWLSSKGLVQTATDSVSKTLNSLTQQYNAASDRVDAMIARYKTQFTQLDLLVSKLNNTSSYLTNQFETSSNSNK